MEIDARGLNCPEPVIKTKNALEESKEVSTLVDNQIACKNLEKLGQKLGYNTDVLKIDEEFQVNFTQGESTVASSVTSEEIEDSGEDGNKVYFIRSETLGKGEEELGEVLIKGFIYTLTETAPLPEAIIFINSGVKLPTLNKEVKKNLKILEEAGMEIISCGTCLEYYGLEDKLEVGEISNMYTIVEKLNSYPVVTV
ncbi:sulfurtransferase-like selenium metabolism protein YedF [Selenihalanaerobacter shriftii]|uniref:Selenium metabolism protein YedF n=1 Tax=Selenihalanaerobacter shriftii TaxID=142842 RepID=A0A1T4R2T4_9FIRM|nr:sulfurtransferase-like selenium metabolism protein YedF [Selenihalanaerobacter shriftii]SKA10263.1 selenium metabolism protein YedF [Selenihalanaerobacter shriftii]